ncbi:MAG: DUF2029 domain-containing protein [Candidatus Lokiarchaeota archaeon]|nr:DUF2029 domain-containing protein [Candidatus Lokiarchaeota archaeon]
MKTMNCKNIKILTKLWNYKIFRIAIVINFIYFLIACVLVFFDIQNDFSIYYKAGKVFIQDISNLYDQSNYIVNDKQWDFRYFPLSCLFFIPFTLLDPKMAFVLFNVLNLILNYMTCIVLYKLIELIRGEGHELDNKRIAIYISIYLVSALHVFNYILGQINLIVSILVLLSLYVMLKREELKWQLLGAFILGITTIVKPITILILPFLFFIHFNKKTKRIEYFLKSTISRISGFLIPLLMNIIVFLVFPSTWNGFLDTNLSGSNPVDINFSFSVTKLIVNFFYIYFGTFNQFLIIIIVLLVVISIAFIFYILGNQEKEFLIYGYIFGSLVMLLAYFDSWNHHLLVFTPLLILAMFNLPKESKITKNYIKPEFFILSFLDLPFLGLWYLTKDFFPFNFAFTIVLILIFYGVCVYCLNIYNNNTKYNRM